jgi:uncharacterized protein YecT (DUF1311 family)
MKRLSVLVCGICIGLVTPAFALDCDTPQTDADVAACLEAELRDSDTHINHTYQTLMGQLDDVKKGALRDEQRAWLKKRDGACQLDRRESDRERWLQAILKDYKKTVCVVRFTRARVEQLERQLATLATPAAPAQPVTPLALEDNDRYEVRAQTRHNKGKWYFEVQLNPGEIARTAETALWVSFYSAEGAVGRLLNIRRRDVGQPIVRLGLALDLDNGKCYSHADGVWRRGAPGSAGGLDVKLGRDYGAQVTSSVAMGELLDKKLIQINFGEKAFDYPMPPGYRPFIER